MQRSTFVVWKPAEDRLSHQVVHERVRSLSGIHQPRLRDDGERRVRLVSADCANDGVRHYPTHDRSDRQHVALAIAQRVDAVIDGAPNAERFDRRGVGR